MYMYMYIYARSSWTNYRFSLLVSDVIRDDMKHKMCCDLNETKDRQDGHETRKRDRRHERGRRERERERERETRDMRHTQETRERERERDERLWHLLAEATVVSPCNTRHAREIRRHERGRREREEVCEIYERKETRKSDTRERERRETWDTQKRREREGDGRLWRGIAWAIFASKEWRCNAMWLMSRHHSIITHPVTTPTNMHGTTADKDAHHPTHDSCIYQKNESFYYAHTFSLSNCRSSRLASGSRVHASSGSDSVRRRRRLMSATTDTTMMALTARSIA